MTPARERALAHRCPGPGCTRPVPVRRLTCPSCWRLVPRPLRDAVWRAWDGGDGAGTPAHAAATGAAIRSLGGAP